jgi:hypothetical protein
MLRQVCPDALTIDQSFSVHEACGIGYQRRSMAFGRRQSDILKKNDVHWSKNKRKASRAQSGAPGWIKLDGGFAVRPCTVIDVSSSGIKLAVDSTVRIPSEFVIMLSQGGPSRRAQVKWRNASQIGAQFI